jgi:formiminoglutamase
MSWPRITDLFSDDPDAEIALLGAPMEAKSVNPGDYQRAPRLVRETLRRFSTYDVETGEELMLRIRDHGDVDVEGVTPEEGFAPIRDAAARCTASHDLTLLLGGHNAVTRPGAHALGVPLATVGLVTLDAHFDLRDTNEGLINGNPVMALLEDGLPGANISQIGLAPFANTAAMHRTARNAGIGVWTIAEAKQQGIDQVLDEALARLDHCEALMVDFDIDVIDRAQCPGAPGARPGGMAADMFFAAARRLGAERRVRLVDLTEFDPGRDVGEVTALTAARWVCEILAGYCRR